MVTHALRVVFLFAIGGGFLFKGGLMIKPDWTDDETMEDEVANDLLPDAICVIAPILVGIIILTIALMR